MRSIFLFLMAVFLCCSCDDAAFHTQKDLPNSWHKDSAVVLKVDKLDSVKPYNLFITLRNDNTYKYSNLFLITQIQFPNGKTLTDTLEYAMANPDGTWLGTGFGDLKENKLWYRENVLFNEKGVYTFSVRQAMRRNGDVQPLTTLEGIHDVGLRIEKTSNKK
ncbi:gliding motility lipoprotein GldH [Flavimarina sp. Hel_I_48]|uniref:gliding motility lipoprotein GldH n=1 Tax=Flavimarina sp. Hel_I_48 TaxID=1392488 RepID=UPI0004DFA82D|nr:gliding motility lipoprotein GldH [Flavimarina sp. Hel_I_48]